MKIAGCFFQVLADRTARAVWAVIVTILLYVCQSICPSVRPSVCLCRSVLCI